jgi:hypothetical protein
MNILNWLDESMKKILLDVVYCLSAGVLSFSRRIPGYDRLLPCPNMINVNDHLQIRNDTA